MFVRDVETSRPLWKQQGRRFVAGLTASTSRLTHMVDEFERALRGTLPADARALRAKIRGARTKLELWDLRTEVHDLVRQAYDKWEAQTRLDDLNSLFEDSGPPSGYTIA
ncbi:MAG: hypothetical protein HS128_16970 [Ideonella sp.]|nr:hypothetical protein [Ideonella sp.]MCC7456990.1 hypothetical protein [Nitrospira sp.]